MAGKGAGEQTLGARTEGDLSGAAPDAAIMPAEGALDERERCLSLAALGFPVVFLTLIAHGFAIFVVRQGYWAPSVAADNLWTAFVVAGLVVGFAISACPGTSLRKN